MRFPFLFPKLFPSCHTWLSDVFVPFTHGSSSCPITPHILIFKISGLYLIHRHIYLCPSLSILLCLLPNISSSPLPDPPQVDQETENWESLEKVRLPLTLNLSQCMLELTEYEQVVQLNNKLLKKHKGNKHTRRLELGRKHKDGF